MPAARKRSRRRFSLSRACGSSLQRASGAAETRGFWVAAALLPPPTSAGRLWLAATLQGAGYGLLATRVESIWTWQVLLSLDFSQVQIRYSGESGVSSSSPLTQDPLAALQWTCPALVSLMGVQVRPQSHLLRLLSTMASQINMASHIFLSLHMHLEKSFSHSTSSHYLMSKLAQMPPSL